MEIIQSVSAQPLQEFATKMSKQCKVKENQQNLTLTLKL